MGFVQNPRCKVYPCMDSDDDRLIRKLSEPLAASLRLKQEGDSVYHHRVVGRLVDEDGEVVLIVEGPHDPIEVPPA